MPKIRYSILEEMFKKAIKQDRDAVHKLNDRYEKTLISEPYHKNPTPLELNYENCRASCVMATSSLFKKDYRKKFLVDAKRLFKKIQKAEKS